MQTKTFRLFISSTFKDFTKEREVLQTKVFPHIKEYASKLGYTFQPIDLRWGVGSEAQLDQRALELCLSEVRTCKTHPHPNFLVMIGDRYGWVPLPYAIEAKEFEMLLEDIQDKNLLLQWYEKDLNQLPLSYVLKERSGEYEDGDVWYGVEDKLRNLLQTAVSSSTLSEELKHKYFLCATEAEVQEGILPYNTLTQHQKDELLVKDASLVNVDPQYIFGFFRDIDKDTKQENIFIADDYDKAQHFKHDVKTQLTDENTLSIDTTQQDTDHLDETYLNEFESRISTFLEKQIQTQKNKEQDKALTPLEIELQAQKHFAMQKCKDFIAQETLLKSIAEYISGDEQQSFVIYGPSGRGKSSLMAKAIQEHSHKKVLFRFVGATPHSSSSKEILTSIFVELNIDVRSEKEKEKEKKDSDELNLQSSDDAESFEDFSYRVYDEIMKLKEEVIIFIDAVDQFANDDMFLWLPKTLPSNVKIVISALEDKKYEKDSSYFTTLKTKTDNLHLVDKFSQPTQLLKNLLAKQSRTLQPHQETYFLEQFETTNTPLYVSVAAQEIKSWKSSDDVQTNTTSTEQRVQDLQATQHGIIKEFITNLYEMYHHNEEFVKKVLGYICASRDGLSESELLTLLATDETFIEQMAPQTWHDNTTKELPLVHWSRLHTELKAFLSQKSQDDEELMFFFHREFVDVIKELSNQRDAHEAIIQANQLLITKHQEEEFNSNRWGRLYATLITEYELRYKNKEKQKVYAKFVAGVGNDGWISEFITNINSISYEHHIHNRMYEAIACREYSLYITKNLYTTDSKYWVKNYTKALNSLAVSYGKQNRPNEAIELEEESLKISEALYDVNPDTWAERYISVLINLAMSYKNKNRQSEAIALEENALKISEALYDKNPDTWEELYTIVLNNLAISYREQNRLNEAITLEKNALKIREALYDKNPDTWAEPYTTTLNNLALSYKKQNSLNEAITLEEKALKILEILYDNNPGCWAEKYTNLLNNLSMSYYYKNYLSKAIALGKKSLKILEVLYDENPSCWVEHYTRALNNLASSFRKQNQNSEAIFLEEKSLKILEVLYDNDKNRWTESYTTVLNNLAFSYRNKNRLSEAITLEEKSLKILKKLYNNNSKCWAEEYIVALNNLALSYKEQNYFKKAITLEEKSRKILEVLYDNDTNLWADSYTRALTNLAISYNKQNQQNEAITIEEKSIKVLKTLHDNNPDYWVERYTTALNNLAFSYLNQKNLSKAITIGERSLKVLEVLYNEKDSNYLAEGYTRILLNLALSYKNNDCLSEAITLEKKALKILEVLYDDNPDHWIKYYTRALINLTNSYDTQNSLTEALDTLRILHDLVSKYYGDDYELTKQVVLEIEKFKAQLNK